MKSKRVASNRKRGERQVSPPPARRTAADGQQPRQRVSKGRRPFFMRDPDIDKLLSMIMALTGEISLLRVRLDTHERILASGERLSAQSIEAFTADDSVESEREAMRQAMLSRIFRILAVEGSQSGQPELERLVSRALQD